MRAISQPAWFISQFMRGGAPRARNSRIERCTVGGNLLSYRGRFHVTRAWTPGIEVPCKSSVVRDHASRCPPVTSHRRL